MRVHIDSAKLDPLLEMWRALRPCPHCGSERVTVQDLARELRAHCAECGETYVRVKDA